MTQPQPAYLYSLAGVSFYEHPTMGDEHPVLVKHNGKFNTGYYDLTTAKHLKLRRLKAKGK